MKKKSERKYSKILSILFTLVIISLIVIQYINAVQQSGSPLVSYLSFDTQSLRDSSTNGNDGEIVCSQNNCDQLAISRGSIVAGKKGPGFNFAPKTAKYAIALPNNAKVSTGSFTIMAWVRFDDTATLIHNTQGVREFDFFPIISEHNLGYTERYILGVNNDHYTFVYKNGEQTLNIDSPKDVYTKYWTHATIVYDKDIRSIKMYLNGILVGERQGDITLTGNEADYKILIGGSNIRSQTLGLVSDMNLFAGKIDEVKIYNYPLTAENIKQEVGNCANDNDCDGRLNTNDNCLDIPNPGQLDSDSDGTGDACEIVKTENPTPNLDAWYKFESDTKDSLTDNLAVIYPSGNRNVVSYVDSNDGKGLLINTQSAGIKLPETQKVGNLDAYTISASFYLDKNLKENPLEGQIGDYPIITEFTAGNGGTDKNKGKYMLSILSSQGRNGLQFTTNKDGTNTDNVMALINEKEWTKVAVVVDKNSATKKIKMYINGELKASKDTYQVDTDNTGYDLIVGAYPSHYSENNFGVPIEYYAGIIDNIKIYKKAITEQEAKTLTLGDNNITIVDPSNPNGNNPSGNLDSNRACTTNTDCNPGDICNGQTLRCTADNPSSGTCTSLGGISCSGSCGPTSLEIPDALDGINGIKCCGPQPGGDLLSVSCISTEYLSSLGSPVQVSRTPCVDEDGDGEGYSVISITPTTSAVEYFTSLGITQEQLEADQSYKEQCTTLPKGANPGETISFYGYSGVIITLLIILAYYLLTKKKSKPSKIGKKRKKNKKI